MMWAFFFSMLGALAAMAYILCAVASDTERKQQEWADIAKQAESEADKEWSVPDVWEPDVYPGDKNIEE